LKRALEIEEKALGAEHPSVASTLEELGWMCHGQHKEAEAEQHLKKAMALYEADLGREHPHVARCCSKLGRVCLSEDHKQEAEDCCRRALGIFEHTGGNDVERAAALEDYAAVLHSKGDHAKARELEAQATLLRASRRRPAVLKP
jgi:tetratricopeptide (TPR) repeat protein